MRSACIREDRASRRDVTGSSQDSRMSQNGGSRGLTRERTITMSLSTRRKVFRALHERGCFVIPNPWDVGSARYLQHLGFPALATTSAGFAFSQGLPDSDVAVSRDLSLGYI